jgi:hypothetical protein
MSKNKLIAALENENFCSGHIREYLSRVTTADFKKDIRGLIRSKKRPRISVRDI